MNAFYTKAKYVLGILVVFSLILMTNLVDRDSFRSVRNSMITIYEDRLLAKDIIYDMFGLISDKELAYAINDEIYLQEQNEAANQRLRNLVAEFEQTKLTEKESRTFDSLQRNFEKLWNYEQEFAQSASVDNKEVLRKIKIIEQDLQELSDIQIAEGRKQLMISQQVVDNVELFTQIEIYILIILAITIQIIIIYRPKNEIDSSS